MTRLRLVIDAVPWKLLGFCIVVAAGALLFLRWLYPPGVVERLAKTGKGRKNRLYELGTFRRKNVVGLQWTLFGGTVEAVSFDAETARKIGQRFIEAADDADRWTAKQKRGG